MFIQDLDDKRNTVRVNFIAEATVVFEEGGRTLRGRLKNLSIEGILLETDEDAAEGALCTVSIVLRDRHSRLTIDELAGAVVRSPGGEIGIKFRHPFAWLTLFHVYHNKSAS